MLYLVAVRYKWGLQGSVLALNCFNIFSNGMEQAAQCTLKCADNSSSYAGGQSCQPGVSGQAGGMGLQEPHRIKQGQMPRKELPLQGCRLKTEGLLCRKGPGGTGRCQERLCHLHHWRFSRLDYAKP